MIIEGIKNGKALPIVMALQKGGPVQKKEGPLFSVSSFFRPKNIVISSKKVITFNSYPKSPFSSQNCRDL